MKNKKCMETRKCNFELNLGGKSGDLHFSLNVEREPLQVILAGMIVDAV
jgi:hypothetical protein